MAWKKSLNRIILLISYLLTYHVTYNLFRLLHVCTGFLKNLLWNNNLINEFFWFFGISFFSLLVLILRKRDVQCGWNVTYFKWHTTVTSFNAIERKRSLIGWESCGFTMVPTVSERDPKSSEKSSENFQNSYDVRYSFNSADCDQSISCNDEHLVSKVWNIFIIKWSRRLFLI